MAKAYPWYTRATDIAHRVTVLSLVGFTLYMTGAIVYNIASTGKENKRRIAIEQKRREAISKQQQLEDSKQSSSQ